MWNDVNYCDVKNQGLNEKVNWDQEWIFWGMHSVQGAARPTKVLLHPKEMFGTGTPQKKFA